MTEESYSISELLHSIADTIRFLDEDLMYCMDPVKVAKQSASWMLDRLQSPQFVDWLASMDGFTVWRFNVLYFEFERMHEYLLDVDDDDRYYSYRKPDTIESESNSEPIDAETKATDMIYEFLNWPEKSWYFAARWIEGLAGTRNDDDIRNRLKGQALLLFQILEKGKPWTYFEDILFKEIVVSRKSDSDSDAAVIKALERTRTAIGTDKYDILIIRKERRAKLVDIRPSGPIEWTDK